MKLRLRRSVCYCLATASYLLLFYYSLLADFTAQQTQVDWQERRRVVKEQCRADPVLLPAQNQFDEGTVGEKVVAHYRRIHEKQLVLNIVHVPKLNLNWCLVPKVASTSISAAILPHLIFGGESQESKFLQKEVWRRAGHLKYEEYRAGQNVTPSFLVTRHPFARVASAFRNKLEDRTKSHDGEYFYNIFSKQIIKYSRGLWTPEAAEPTFAEFVHYLINTDIADYDEHWLPVSLRCRVCQLQYSHILHFENFHLEWKQFLQDIKLEEDLELPWENKGAGSLMNYYDLITSEEKIKLYRKYQADFLMFGYNIEDEF